MVPMEAILGRVVDLEGAVLNPVFHAVAHAAPVSFVLPLLTLEIAELVGAAQFASSGPVALVRFQALT